jgi:CPA1 family monovalent cation:H+ antiporter
VVRWARLPADTGVDDERRIDDTVPRRLQSKLDIEEVRLSRREITE